MSKEGCLARIEKYKLENNRELLKAEKAYFAEHYKEEAKEPEKEQPQKKKK